MYGLFVKKHAEAAALKHRVSVFYIHAANQLDHPHEMEINKGVFNEYFYYYKKANTGITAFNSFLNLWRYIKGYIVLRRQINKPDLIHVHILTRLGVIAYLANKLNNIPYVVTEHWSRYRKGSNTYKGFFRKWATKVVTSNASVFTTVTNDLKSSMKDHGIDNPSHKILYNVVDTKVFFPENRTHKNDYIKNLCHVSCFDDEPKNISGLVDCINELYKIRQDFRVELIGTGKDLDKIKNKVAQLGLGNIISFTGQLEGTELGNHVRGADVLMLFSNYENLPVVINEAFCCGVPVIATNVGGIKEVINNTNGKLVDKGDVESFVNELNYMLNHLHEYNPKTMSEDAINKFSITSVSEQLDEIYLRNSYV